MSVTDTLEFVLGCYDFDGTGYLTIDEVNLPFKSTVTGMCKLEGSKGAKSCPRDTEFEAAAIDAFGRRAGPDHLKVKVRSMRGSRAGVCTLTRAACYDLTMAEVLVTR